MTHKVHIVKYDTNCYISFCQLQTVVETGIDKETNICKRICKEICIKYRYTNSPCLSQILSKPNCALKGTKVHLKEKRWRKKEL